MSTSSFAEIDEQMASFLAALAPVIPPGGDGALQRLTTVFQQAGVEGYSGTLNCVCVGPLGGLSGGTSKVFTPEKGRGMAIAADGLALGCLAEGRVA
eukprot:1682486-Heterocapsa_arctica.AAC.1